jgi:hypothetical protein
LRGSYLICQILKISSKLAHTIFKFQTLNIHKNEKKNIKYQQIKFEKRSYF